MRYPILLSFVFVALTAPLFAQLPPTIHRIAPVDTAVDLTDHRPDAVIESIDESHGKAFCPLGGGLMLPGSSKLNGQPLRIELLAKLDDAKSFNILLAHEPKSSPRHWELFTRAGDGKLAVYLPGNKPDHLVAPISVTDGRWRRIVLEFKDETTSLFLDGNAAGAVPMNRPKAETPDGTVFAVGSLVEGSLTCSGAVDDLRVFGSSDTLLYACDFEPLNGADEPEASQLTEPMQRICTEYSLAMNFVSYRIDGVLAERCGYQASIQSNLLDRLFPSAGPGIEPTVRPGEKPPKNVPKLDGGHDDLRKAVKKHGLTSINPENYRPGVFANWGEQFVDLQNQIDGKTKLPRGAADQVLDRHALILPEERHPAQIILRRCGALIEHLVSGGASLPANVLDDFNRLKENISHDNDSYFAACALRREIMFADPELTSFDRILFLGRACYAGSRLTNARNSDRMGGHFATQNYGFNTIHGGGVFTIEGWRTKNPSVKNLIEGRTVVPGAEGRLAGRKLDDGSFNCPELDFDGQTVYFSHTGSQEHRWLWTPDTVWNLFKMQVDGSDIVQLTDGPYNDFDPCPLPDGRVVFISERRGGFIRCFAEDAWLRVTTYVLHSMKHDGSDIYPISYFETSEWQPSVDNSGMLVFTRWDYTDRENCLGSLFWTCFPDGRNPRAPHGNYPLPWHTLEHNPLSKIDGDKTPLRDVDDFDKSKPLHELVDDTSFLIGKKHGDHRFGNCPDAPSALPMTEMHIRAIPNSHKYVLVAAPHHGETFGSICVLDLREKNDYHMNQIRRVTPYTPFPESEMHGRGQYRYGTPWPVNETTFLCNSWEDLVVLDRFGNEELVCEREILPIGYDPRLRLTKPVPVRPRKVPPVIPQQTAQGEDFSDDNKSATIGVVNVNISDMPLPRDRPIKSLRVLQVVPKPNPWMNKPDIGYAPENTPRIPLGTVPVEDDGSVFFEAPPGKQLLFQTLDERGMAVQTMRAVAFTHPGEQLVCTGCHEPTQSTPPTMGHGKAFRRPPSKLRPEIGPIEPVSFYRTVKPVFEQKCVGCHVEEKKGPQRMDFGDMKPYVFYFAGGMLGTTVRSGTAGGSRSIPGNVGAAASRLGEVLFDENHRETIFDEDRRRIILWLDSNAPRLGAFIDEEAQRRGELVWPVLDVE